MKKILFSLAAVAAMVGCAKDAPIVDNTNNTPEETLAISASIDLSDTRVTIEGEEFTDVKWAQGDFVRLVSVEGVNTELQTRESGDTNVRFRGEAEYEADVDTYYAVYPSTTITNGVASFDLATQNGKATNAAVLAATTKDAAKGVIDMAFKPINALLHVAVTGAPAIKTAEFLAFRPALSSDPNDAKFASGFSYDFATETVTPSGTTTVLTINNPDAAGFFFSLPAGLNMANGYIVRLTDTNNNVCSKAYNGKTFERGTTTRVTIEWSQPTVTLGTPMTSYSYYAAGNVSAANNCANNIIYFPNASTYANVQNAMVTEVGVNVDGTDYTAEKANKSFTPAEVTVSSWGEHTVKAYIKTKDGKVYQSAPQTVHITGLPYDYTFDGELADFRSAGWATNGTLRPGKNVYYRNNGVVLQYNGDEGFIVSPKFEVPTNVAVQASIVRSSYYLVSNVFGTYYENRTGYVGPVANKTTSNTSSVTFSSKGRTVISYNDVKYFGSGEWLTSFELTASTPYISIDCDSKPANSTTSIFYVHEAHFRYAQ